MPKIQWLGLPIALRDHLFERLRERRIAAEDLYQLKLWRESEPEAPDGPWYKDSKTSARSRYAARGNTRRPSCLQDNQREGKSSKPRVGPVARLPRMEELNIGHALVSRAVLVGMEAAVEEMLAAMRGE